MPALLLNPHQRRKLRQSVWQWDCIIIRYYKSQWILHLYTMKVIHNLIVTSIASVCSKAPLTSASAQRLHSRVCLWNTCPLWKFYSRVPVRALDLNSWVRTCIKSVPYSTYAWQAYSAFSGYVCTYEVCKHFILVTTHNTHLSLCHTWSSYVCVMSSVFITVYIAMITSTYVGKHCRHTHICTYSSLTAVHWDNHVKSI